MIKGPKGELTIQTLAMPMDTNANGDIFGGWIVSQMDLAVGILAKKISGGRIATVAINSMTFLKPVHVGDVISCHVELMKQGKTSMTIGVEVWAMPSTQIEQYQVTEGVFVSVAIDEHGMPRQVAKKV
jgi:acyl-CoA thioesterase YciA